MGHDLTSKDRLQRAAKSAFWARGYSNVALREIARDAGVDVALIKRYFGDKLGLFAATLEGAFDTSALPQTNGADLIEAVVHLFSIASRNADDPSVIRLILMNAHEAEVGELVRAAHTEQMQSYLEQVIGDPTCAALFMAVILGASVAEKSLRLRAMAPLGSPEYAAELRYMLRAALAYGGTK
jgi:AcrR family transcriptional regulator